MLAPLPYCGTPPVPGALLQRFNLDPVLICALLLVVAVHLAAVADRHRRMRAAAGWSLATLEPISNSFRSGI